MAGRFLGSRVAVAAALILLCGCTPLPTYRYAISVEVETPEGLRTGSSVIEVRSRSEPRLLPDMTGHDSRAIGEAVAVDLPGGQTLFATLVGENSEGYAETIAGAALLPARETAALDRAEKVRRIAGANRRGAVPRNAYPLLVRFRDIRRPETAEGVNPDDLAASFGTGIRLRRIMVARTSETPTFSLHNRLLWLGQPIMGATARGSDGVGHLLNSEAFQRR